MRNLSRTGENSFVNMTMDSSPSHMITNQPNLSQLVVIRTLNRQNVGPPDQDRDRHKRVTDRKHAVLRER